MPHLAKSFTFPRYREIHDVQFSADNRTLYFATSAGLYSRDVVTGKALSKLWSPVGWSQILKIDASPDGRYLAALASHKNSHHLLVWDPETKKLKKNFRVDGSEEIAFSPDSRWLAISDETAESPFVSLWNTKTWKPEKHLSFDGGLPPYYLDFSGDSQRFAGASYYSDAAIGDLEVWGVQSGKKIRYDDEMAEGPLYFMPDGQKLAFGFTLLNSDARSRNYGINDENDSQNIFHAEKDVSRWLAARLARHSNVFVVKKWTGKTERETLELWDISLKKRIAQWNVSSGTYQAYSCSPNGRWLAVFSWEGPMVRLYKISG